MPGKKHQCFNSCIIRIFTYLLTVMHNILDLRIDPWIWLNILKQLWNSHSVLLYMSWVERYLDIADKNVMWLDSSCELFHSSFMEMATVLCNFTCTLAASRVEVYLEARNALILPSRVTSERHTHKQRHVLHLPMFRIKVNLLPPEGKCAQVRWPFSHCGEPNLWTK